jgi:hypothetical protein
MPGHLFLSFSAKLEPTPINAFEKISFHTPLLPLAFTFK